MDERPIVTLGPGVSPELVADVSSALEELGVVVQTADTTPGHGHVIVVLSPKGGSGKTVLSSNLALAIAERYPGRVVAVDLDVQFGDFASALALTPERNFAQLVLGDQLDGTTIKLFLTPTDYGLFVLAGAANPVEAEAIGHDHVTRVLAQLSSNFDYVIVDTPAGLDDRTLAAVECATDLLLVSSLEVTSIRSLRKALDALDQLEVDSRRRFVLNRADAKVGITAGDAEAAIGLPIESEIPFSGDVPLSMNVGVPVVIGERKSAVTRAIHRLADLYAPVDRSKTRRGWRR